MTTSYRLKVETAGGLPAPERYAPWAPGRPCGGTWDREGDGVDSVQWIDLPGPSDLDLAFLEPVYFAWVPRLSVGTVLPRHDGGSLSLGVVPLHWPVAIRMGEAKSTGSTRARPILGGMLASQGGSMVFHTERRPEGIRLVVAVRSMRPRLPLWVYFMTQARIHERSTFAFLRQVRRAWRRRDESSGTLSSPWPRIKTPPSPT